MYLLKGFVTYPPFVNNEEGVVSPIGEISKDSLTYAIETGIYTNKSISDSTLYSFISEKDDVPVVVENHYRDLCLEISKTIYEGSITQTYLNDVLGVSELVITKHGSNIENLSFGNMVSDGSYWIPEYIVFKSKITDSYIKLWFADNSFSTQYEEYEYIFVGPVDNLDSLFDSAFNVDLLLKENNITTIINKTNVATDKKPYTVLRTELFNWVDPVNELNTLPTMWTIAVYGKNGDNLDIIKPKLIEWVLNNSTKTKEEWLELIPDLFKVKEFTIIPFWHLFAIPNRTVQAGINSPMTTLGEINEVVDLVQYNDGYNRPVVDENTIVTFSPIRNLIFTIIGSEFNRDNVTLIDTVYKDYINAPVGSLDFTRMDTLTQAWVNFLIELLVAADTATIDSVNAEGFDTVIRNGIVYASKVFEETTYLMATRESVLERLGIRAPDSYCTSVDGTCSIDESLFYIHTEQSNNPHETNPSDIGLDNFNSTVNPATLLDIVNELTPMVNVATTTTFTVN